MKNGKKLRVRGPKFTDIATARTGLRYNTEAFHNGDSSSIDVVFTLRETNRVIQALIDDYARPYELSAARSNVLLALYASEDRTLLASEIAAALYYTRGNVTGLVASLVEDGLVETFSDRHDGRRTLVKLSAHGHAVLHSYAPRHYATLDTVIGTLSRDEKAQLIGLLDRVRASAEKSRSLEPAPK